MKYKEPPKGMEIIWVKVIKELPKCYRLYKVGDITWVYKYHSSKGKLDRTIHPEDNRYCENFPSEYFEIIPGPSKDPQYEIY